MRIKQSITLFVLIGLALFILPLSVHASTQILDSQGFVGHYEADIPSQQNYTTSQGSPEEIAREFLSKEGAMFGIKNQSEELETIDTDTASSNSIQFGMFIPTPTALIDHQTQHVKFQQVYDAIPVYGSTVLAHIKDGAVLSVDSIISPDISLTTIASIDQNQAQEKALSYWKSQSLVSNATLPVGLFVLNPSLVSDKEDTNYLVWQFILDTGNTSNRQREFIFIDAHNGSIRLVLPGIFDGRNRNTYGCSGATSASGCRLLLTENQTTSGDSDADNTHRYVGNTYDFYFQKDNRLGMNNRDGLIKSYTNIPCQRPNAYWDGTSINFCHGMMTQDIVSHEYTHGVTQYSANLGGSNQSGALNESISDIFASNVDGNWTVGEDSVIGRERSSHAIRDMSNPARLGDPDKLFSKNYSCSSSDSGGVHKNSGVTSKAVYLLTDGSTFNGCTISGIGRDKAQKIEYLMLTQYLPSSANFRNFYDGMNSACGELYGKDSTECKQVDYAMKAVEIDQQPLRQQKGASCTGRREVTPSCSTSGTPSAPTASPSPTTSSPTITGTLSPTSVLNPTPTTGADTSEVSVWTSSETDPDGKLSDGSKLDSKVKRGQKISICYNRSAGPFSLTIDTGISPRTISTTFSEPKHGGCLMVNGNRFLRVGPLASSEGYKHTFTITSGGKTVSTSILAVTP